MREPGLNGPQLRQLRRSFGMSAKAFAAAAGYEYGYYRAIEASKREVNRSIKMCFKRILLEHAKNQALVLESWDPGISKLDIRKNFDGSVRLSRKGV
jgi:hypothetical protein